jgi:transposase
MENTSQIAQDWTEGRRLRAWELSQMGWRQRDIAVALGVTKGAVSQWLKRARTGGVESLRRRPKSGAPPRLTSAQRAQIPALLTKGAAAYGFRGDLWTCARVADVIRREFGVTYHPDHVGRILKAIDWTPQKPIRRATQRNETAIANWVATEWPALKKRLATKGE